MKSKISLFDKSILINDIKRYGWVSIIYLLALSLIPLIIILQALDNIGPNRKVISNVLDESWNLEGIFMLIISTLLGILLFNYLQTKDACDSIHSLPIKREVLYRTHIFSGLLILIIPILINMLIIIILRKTIDVQFMFNFKDIFLWAFLNILFSIFFFLVSVFSGMLTASSILQGLISIVLLLLPAFLYITIIYNLGFLVFGYSNYRPDIYADYLSPVIRILDRFHKISITEIIVYSILSVLLAFSSMLIYKIRKLEMAGQSIAFPKLNYLFKYTAAFCGMLLFGSFSKAISMNVYSIYVSYLIGSLLCYYIAEMIINKNFWVFRKIKDYIYFCFIILLIFIGIKIDIIGYERYIPKMDDIKAIYFNEYGYEYGYYSSDKNDYLFSDKNSILQIRNLHNAIIRNKKKVLSDNNKNFYNRMDFVIIYELKNNKKITRAYPVSNKSILEHYLKPIYENRNYKEKNNLLFKVNLSNVKAVYLEKINNVETKYKINSNDINEIINILKEEKYDEKYEDMISNRPPWGNINIKLNNNIKYHSNPYIDEVYIEFKKSYNKLEKWLEKKGYIKYARILPEDVNYAAIGKITDIKTFQNDIINQKYDKLINGSIKKVKDKSLIEKYLREYKLGYGNSQNNKYYYILFVGNNKAIIDVGILDNIK